jgi:hypothetical protein
MDDESLLPKKFIDEFMNIPSAPSHLYAGVRHRIDRKRAVMRTVWAVAASLILMVTALQTARLLQPADIPVAEAAEELTTVDSYINSTVYKEDDSSYVYYEETLYQE